MERDGADYLVCNCIEEECRDILLLYDDTTQELVPVFYAALLKYGKSVEIIKLEVGECHGT